MDNMQKNIGDRLKEIRDIIFEGGRISARQFAQSVGETKDNIANYENGRANVPNRLLAALYHKGINPIYILTGEGTVNAPNEAGKIIAQRIKYSGSAKSNVAEIHKIDFAKMDFDELVMQFNQLTAAAGDMINAIQKNNKDVTTMNQNNRKKRK
jgi:hypothetical protein